MTIDKRRALEARFERLMWESHKSTNGTGYMLYLRAKAVRCALDGMVHEQARTLQSYRHYLFATRGAIV